MPYFLLAPPKSLQPSHPPSPIPASDLEVIPLSASSQALQPYKEDEQRRHWAEQIFNDQPHSATGLRHRREWVTVPRFQLVHWRSLQPYLQLDWSMASTNINIRSKCFGPPMVDVRLGITPGSTVLFKLWVIGCDYCLTSTNMPDPSIKIVSR
jgi:hypothetical protein